MQQPQRVGDPPDRAEQQARRHQPHPEGHVQRPGREVPRGLLQPGHGDGDDQGGDARATACRRRRNTRCVDHPLHPGRQGPPGRRSAEPRRPPEQQQDREAEQDRRAGTVERQARAGSAGRCATRPRGPGGHPDLQGGAAPCPPRAAPTSNTPGIVASKVSSGGAGRQRGLQVVAVHVHLVGDVAGDDEGHLVAGGHGHSAGVPADLPAGDVHLDPLPGGVLRRTPPGTAGGRGRRDGCPSAVPARRRRVGPGAAGEGEREPASGDGSGGDAPSCLPPASAVVRVRPRGRPGRAHGRWPAGEYRPPPTRSRRSAPACRPGRRGWPAATARRRTPSARAAGSRSPGSPTGSCRPRRRSPRPGWPRPRAGRSGWR